MRTSSDNLKMSRLGMSVDGGGRVMENTLADTTRGTRPTTDTYQVRVLLPWNANGLEDYHRVLLKALGKPWPTRVSTLGLMIDDKTPAPTMYVDTSDESASPSPIIRPSKPRSLSDYASSMSGGRRERSSAPQPYGRPTMQRSHTQPSPPKSRGIAIPDILNRYRTQTPADPLSLKVNSTPTSHR